MHYHTPEPFFRASRRTWYVQLDGKQINLGKDRQEAIRRYHELMAVRPLERPSRLTSPQGLLLTDLFDRFLEWSLKNRSEATYHWYRPLLQRFAERYPDLRVEQLKPYHVQQWVDGFARHSKTTTRNHMRAIKRCIKWAKSLGYIDNDPLEGLPVPSGESREVFISPEEFATILTFTQNDALRQLMVVTYETGCRPQESLRLEIRHVDPENQRWVFPREEAKGKKSPRIVYLTDKACEITRELIGNRSEGHVFLNSNGLPWTPDAVNCGIQRIRYRVGKAEMERLGITITEQDLRQAIQSMSKTKKVKGKRVQKTDAEIRWQAKWKLRERLACQYGPQLSLYALRHSWATNALQRGVDSLTVAILMGHRDPSMLAKVYQHLSHNPKHMLAEARRAVASGE